MLDTKNIHLITHDLATGAFEASTLERWIQDDLNLYYRAKEHRPKSNWIIIAAVGSPDEAKERLADFEKNRRAG
jgi:hypothetical protein